MLEEAQLSGIAVAGLLEPFGRVGQVPGLQLVQAQFVAGEGLQFGAITARERQRAAGQVAQELQHLVRRLRHLGHQRVLRVTGKTQQRSLLGAQGQDAPDQAAVVQFGRA